ncbi:MAG: hypothetical protein COA69_11260 [Robiginitomaculum sp.]|nr:MAG: hypothetical protein COA69_11260 [Robiginitomaculum sp.]
MRQFICAALMAGLVGISAPAMAKGDKYLDALNVQLGYREATSYAVNAEKRGIDVGIEPIDKDGMQRLLGNDTKKFRPYDVAITNNSQFRIYINQITIVHAGTQQAFAWVDLDGVVDAIDPGGRGNKDDMRGAALRNNVIDKALAHGVVAPGETVQGIVFVKAKYRDEGAALFLQIQNLKRVAFLDFTLALK